MRLRIVKDFNTFSSFFPYLLSFEFAIEIWNLYNRIKEKCKLNGRRGFGAMEDKNRFSILLEHLLEVAEVKNYTLAKRLQYDVS